MSKPGGRAPLVQPEPPAPAPPRIPESWLTTSEQRLYAVALLGAMQIYKLSDVLFYLFQSTISSTPSQPPAGKTLRILQLLPYNWVSSFVSLDNHYLLKWLWWDAVLVVGVAWLRIPGLRYGVGRMVIYLSFLYLIDTVLMGKFHIWPAFMQALALVAQFIRNPLGKVTTLSDHTVRPQNVLRADEHLLGSLTLKIQPAGIAQFNPTGATYCIPPDQQGQPVFIPIILNNSNPDVVQFSVRSYVDDASEVSTSFEEVKSHQLKRSQASALVKHRREYEFDDEDDEVLAAGSNRLLEYGDRAPASDSPDNDLRRSSVKPGDMASALPRQLEPTQKIYYLPITKTGHIDLVRVIDDDGIDFKLRRTAGALVIECPSEEGVLAHRDAKRIGAVIPGLGRKPEVKVERRCIDTEDVVELQVKGVGTLSVGWRIEEIGGQRTVEEGLVEGIESPETQSSANAPSSDQQLVLRDTKQPAILNPLRAHVHTVSLPISHVRPGRFDVVLHTIADSFNNVVHPAPEGSIRSFEVHDRPRISFSGACSKSEPLQLLVGGKTSLEISPVQGSPSQNLQATLSFRPIDTGQGEGWTRDVAVSGHTQYAVSEPGVYTLDDVQGEVCPGTINEPASCVVKQVPKPHALVNTTALPGCAGDELGIRAAFEMTGTPPFQVLVLRTQHGTNKQVTNRYKFHGAYGEVDLKPQHAGEYTYAFQTISDSLYRDVPIDADTVEQKVYPEASITVRRGTSQPVIWSCATNETSVDLDVAGSPPFTVGYAISWPGKTVKRNVTIEKEGLHPLAITVPKELTDQASGGGVFTVEVFTVTDGKKCNKSITSHNIASFEVKTTRPSVRFGTVAGKSSVSIPEGSKTKLPVHLTGEGNWSVRLRLPDGKIHLLRVSKPSDQIEVESSGVYELLEVADEHCQGDVIFEEDKFEVNYIPRPILELAMDNLEPTKRGVLKRKDVCKGVDDHVLMSVEGHGPFTVLYRHTHISTSGQKDTRLESLRFAQDQGALHLSSRPGEHTYELLAVGDHSYPLPADHAKHVKSPLFALSQKVHDRPRASLDSPTRPSFCLYDAFKRQSGSQAVVQLRGEPPFSLDIDILQPGSRRPIRHTIDGIKSHKWKVAVPDHVFSVHGLHTLSISGVRDSSECAAEVSEDDVTTMGIDVVEPASIVAVDRRTDHCVGDMLEFVLQGTSPWTVTYVWNGKTKNAAVKTPKFSRLADKPGKFSIASVAHQQNQCLAKVTDIERTIHPIPTAKVREGNTLIQNVHEGDQVEIIFSFAGTPPFTFTYVRSTLTGKKGALNAQDTQTVTGITENTYSIFSSTEGEYHVTYIADAYCSYPPSAQGNPTAQKQITM